MRAAHVCSLCPPARCLELLIEYGLAGTDKNNWLLCEDDLLLPNPSETMHFQLIQAIHRGYPDRAELLVDNGVDLNKPDDTYESRTKGKKPYEAALLLGQQDIADALLEAGARPTNLSTLDAFEVTCMAGDADGARELLNAYPDLAEQIIPCQRQLLCDAVKVGNSAGLATMIALNLELNDVTGRTPLHEAALHNNVEIAKLLLDAGADPKLRDPDYFSPPIGFAQHAGNDSMIAFFDTAEMDIFTAAARGNIDQIEARLAEDARQLNMRFAQVRPRPEKPCATDWMTPIVYAVLNCRTDAVWSLLERGADPAVGDGEVQSLLGMAEAQGDPAIISLIRDRLGTRNNRHTIVG